MPRQTTATKDRDRRQPPSHAATASKQTSHRFQDIGIAAVAAAAIKREFPRPERAREVPPCLRRGEED